MSADKVRSAGKSDGFSPAIWAWTPTKQQNSSSGQLLSCPSFHLYGNPCFEPLASSSRSKPLRRAPLCAFSPDREEVTKEKKSSLSFVTLSLSLSLSLSCKSCKSYVSPLHALPIRLNKGCVSCKSCKSIFIEHTHARVLNEQSPKICAQGATFRSLDYVLLGSRFLCGNSALAGPINRSIGTQKT